MESFKDNKAVKSRTELLTTMQHQQVKQHMIYDATFRPIFMFVAPVDAKDGAPCLCTEYVYTGPGSSTIIARQERVYAWKAAWESSFTFDPTADYDPDGDGTL